jgi:phosphoserine phosphatase
MALALFDLDKTLLGGDSDFLWGEFLSEIGALLKLQKNPVKRLGFLCD